MLHGDYNALLVEQTTGFANRYSAVASDGKGAKDAREAAMLLSVAEGHIQNEEEDEALSAAQDALAYFRTANDHMSTADALHIIIQCYILQGRLEEASSLAQSELAGFRKAGNTVPEAKMLTAMSEVSMGQSKGIDDALGYCNTALSLFREARDEKMEASTWLLSARIRVSKGKKNAEALREAQNNANDASGIYKKIGDRKGEAAALHLEAEAKAAGGNFDEAVELAEEAIQLLQDVGQPKLEAFELSSIASWYLKSGRAFKAMHFAENALEMIRDSAASKKKEVEALGTLVQANIAKGLTSKAVKLALAGLKRFQNAGETRAEASTQRVLYAAYVANGDAEKASFSLEKALDAAEEAGDREIQSRLLCEASDLYFKSGKFDEAAESANKALGFAQASSDWDGLNVALQSLVAANIAQDEAKTAVDLAKDIREMLESSGHTKAEASACLILSQAHNAAGSPDLAAAAAKAASEIAYQEEDEILEANALDQLTSVYMDSGKFEKAARASEQSRRIWKEMDDLPRECKALDQIAKAYVHQAYKKQVGTKSSGAVAGIFEKATKAANECIAMANELPAGENGKAFIANSHSVLSQVHAAIGDSVDAYAAAKIASDLFGELRDDRGGAYAAVLMAQADVQQSNWDKALKNANVAMKGFKKYNDEGGKQFAQTLLDKIEKSMPKPQPVFAPMGAQQGSWKVPVSMQSGMQMQQMPEAGGGGGGDGAIARTGSALDMSTVSEEIIIAKVREIALAVVGEDAEDVELDTPLMEAGLTSSTAVLLRDELMKDIPGVNLAPTLIFDYPSVGGIAEFIMEKLGK